MILRRRLGSVVIAAALVALGASALHAATGTPIKVARGTQLVDGAWRPLAHGGSRRTMGVAMARGFLAAPTALAFTVTTSPAQRVRLFWSVYCEGQTNDEIFAPQGAFKFRTPFSAYPPVLTDATKCFLTVRATPTRAGRARVTIFGY